MKPESSIHPLPPQVEAWLNEQPAPDRRALEETWCLTEHGRPTMSPSDRSRKGDVWTTVWNSTRRRDREEMPRPRLRLVASRSRHWVAAAAVAFVITLLGVGYAFRPISVYAPNGAFAEATLPDGSTVHLNSGSTLSYRAHFLGSRVVQLEGEAFFDVVQDEDPFVVETFNARTTVLGTEFNVRARQDEDTPTTSVVVAEGRVRVTARDDDAGAVVLNPGQRSLVKATQPPTAPSRVLVEHELLWRSGGLHFSNEPFSVIFGEIERRFNVEISAPIDLRAESYAIHLHSPASAEAVLADLAQAEGLRYRETANGYEVYRP